MEQFAPTERPNTVSGLNAKRDELLAYRKALHAEVRKVTCDIDHLEACIRLFDPDTAPAAFKRYIVQHRAEKGTVRRFIMRLLREASGPLTSRQIAEAWVADRGLRCDEQTAVVIRKRVGAALTALRNQNVARQEGMIDGLIGWVRV
jgi:anti-sigma factor RsiW